MHKQLISPFALEQKKMSEQIYGGGEPEQLDGWRCSARIPKEVALSIYQQTLCGGVVQHLQTHFPVTYAYIGAQAYQAICIQYLKKSPPDQPIFTIYAAHFPGFLVEYGEQNPQQAIWAVAARLAQIDFFHLNTFSESQRIEVEDDHYQLWINAKEILDNVELLNEQGLYRQLDLHPEKHLPGTGEQITLVTFWDEGELFFRKQ
jgi:hypothetical protein